MRSSERARGCVRSKHAAVGALCTACAKRHLPRALGPEGEAAREACASNGPHHTPQVFEPYVCMYVYVCIYVSMYIHRSRLYTVGVEAGETYIT